MPCGAAVCGVLFWTTLYYAYFSLFRVSAERFCSRFSTLYRRGIACGTHSQLQTNYNNSDDAHTQ